MSKSAFVFLAVAVFAGVFGALELDRVLAARGHGADPAIAADAAALEATPVEEVPDSHEPPDFRYAARKALPSVVSVDRYERIEHFFQEPTVEETASGSGVILTKDGVIVTNNHVVADATEVRVRLADRRSFTAKVLGRDPASDIAVLKIAATGLTPIEMGDSDAIAVGQWVVAVGNPLGFDQTLSVGVVSNKSRSLPTEGSILVNAIQTDAAINPGNSGGALTDAAGRLIGIDSAISSNTGTNIGIGFAIPAKRVQRIAADILRTGHARNPYLGLRTSASLDGLLDTAEGRSQLERALGVNAAPSSGLVVPPNNPQLPSMDSGGPAWRAGIRPLDVILEIDGIAIADRLDYYRALDGKLPGDAITVKYWSRGRTSSVRIVLAEEPVES